MSRLDRVPIDGIRVNLRKIMRLSVAGQFFYFHLSVGRPPQHNRIKVIYISAVQSIYILSRIGSFVSFLDSSMALWGIHREHIQHMWDGVAFGI